MKNRVVSICLLLALALSLFSVWASADNNQAVMESREGVVRVLSIFSNGIGTGSAFGVGRAGRETDTFVTNTHVVFDGTLAEEVYIVTTDDAVKFYYNDQGAVVDCELDYDELIPCEVLHYESGMYPDVAIIKAQERIPGRVALPLMGDNSLESTEEIFALGFPAQADLVQIGDNGEQNLKSGTGAVYITKGTVANVTEAPLFGNTYMILHDAVINNGNSGGPLINTDGVVVGINTYGYNAGGDMTTTQYAAVHMEEVLAILEDEEIDYETGSGSAKGSKKKSKESSDDGFGKNLLYVAAAVAVLAVAAVVLMLVKKKMAQMEKAAVAVGASRDKVDEMSKTVAARYAVRPSVNDGKPRLQCVSGVFANQRFSIDGQVRIGRDAARNDLVYPHDTQGISGAHCVVIYDGRNVYLKDLGSTYGTFLANGQKLVPDLPVRLQNGDRFWLGSDKQMFVIDGYRGMVSKSAAAPVVPGVSAGREMPTVAAPAALQCVAGSFAGQRFGINGTFRIGRDPANNDLVYPAETQGISGTHCVLTMRGGTLWLEDLGSSYGTYLGNGQKLSAGVPVQLKPGERFWLASEKELFVIKTQPIR